MTDCPMFLEMSKYCTIAPPPAKHKIQQFYFWSAHVLYYFLSITKDCPGTICAADFCGQQIRLSLPQKPWSTIKLMLQLALASTNGYQNIVQMQHFNLDVGRGLGTDAETVDGRQ